MKGALAAVCVGLLGASNAFVIPGPSAIISGRSTRASTSQVQQRVLVMSLEGCPDRSGRRFVCRLQLDGLRVCARLADTSQTERVCMRQVDAAEEGERVGSGYAIWQQERFG